MREILYKTTSSSFQRKKNQKDIQNLRQEFEIQRTLCHPNIIRMLDSFETDDDVGIFHIFNSNLYC